MHQHHQHVRCEHVRKVQCKWCEKLKGTSPHLLWVARDRIILQHPSRTKSFKTATRCVVITSQLPSRARSLRCMAVACFCYHHKAHRCYDSSRRLSSGCFNFPVNSSESTLRCLWVVGFKPPGEKLTVCAGSRFGGEMQPQIAGKASTCLELFMLCSGRNNPAKERKGKHPAVDEKRRKESWGLDSLLCGSFRGRTC